MGDQCKLCLRVFTSFMWKREKESRYLKTSVCTPCASLKNLCQCCLLDLDFNIPLYVRDALLAENENLVVGPKSAVTTIYETEQALKKMTTRGDFHQHSAKTTDLLLKMVRGEQSTKKRPKTPEDKNIKTLYVSGLEAIDLIEESDLRVNFEIYGTIKSIVINRKQDCALITFEHRKDAEIAAESLFGRLFIKDRALKLLWAKPKKSAIHRDDEEEIDLVSNEMSVIPTFPVENTVKTIPPPPGSEIYSYPSMLNQ